jgi:hypothetical protein
MGLELSHFLGRERYERKGNPSNHRNGSYHRDFTLKGIRSPGPGSEGPARPVSDPSSAPEQAV